MHTKELSVKAPMLIEVIKDNPERCSWSCPAITELTETEAECFIFRSVLSCSQPSTAGAFGADFARAPASSPYRCQACLKAATALQ